MAQFDTEFRFIYVNQAFCDLSGISSDNLTGTKIADLKILKLEVYDIKILKMDG
jgi:PAS domain S-box-containing protein